MPANEIQIGRLNALLHKLLDMKEGAPAPVLGTDLFATLVLESDRPEWAFLKGERLCVGMAAVSAVAGNKPAAILNNPDDSGTLIVLERMFFYSGTAGVHRLYPMVDQSGWTLSTLTGMRDSRGYPAAQVWGLSRPTGVVRYTNTSLPGSVPVATWYLAANAIGTLEDPFVITPGNGVSIFQIADNVTENVTFVWRERALEQSETR